MSDMKKSLKNLTKGKYLPGEEPTMECAMESEQMSDDGRYEIPHPETVRINRILRQRDALAFLCGQILATLRLPENADHKISELSLDIAKWHVEFKKQSGEPF